jgi:hypothetical protein
LGAVCDWLASDREAADMYLGILDA